MDKPVVKRGRKALETLNKVSPVAIQTAKKVRGSCFATGLFLLLQQEKIYKHNRKEKREKQQARIYKKRGEIKECRRGIYSKGLRGVRDVITSRI